MCLAIPMKVIELDGPEGKVESGGVVYNANFTLIPDVMTGDYVLIHAGFAIEKLDEHEAQKTIDLFKEIYESEKE